MEPRGRGPSRPYKSAIAITRVNKWLRSGGRYRNKLIPPSRLLVKCRISSRRGWLVALSGRQDLPNKAAQVRDAIRLADKG